MVSTNVIYIYLEKGKPNIGCYRSYKKPEQGQKLPEPAYTISEPLPTQIVAQVKYTYDEVIGNVYSALLEAST